MKTTNTQIGGTLLGLMIGVVLGLAVALAVAVYVTKSPLGFANKGQAHSTESDANEVKKNKDWDPNAALYGKNPAKPTLPGATPTTPIADANTPAGNPNGSATNTPIAPTTTPAPTAKAPTTPVVPGSLSPSVPATNAKTNTPSGSTDPIGDLVKAKTDAKSSNPALDPFVYFVQAGAYRNADDAEAQRARLSLAGVDAKVTEREQAGRTVYRVRVGPFNKESEAERLKEKISATGADAALVRAQR
ncbi:MAG TPA: SPOR domain-containing protein [Burkholderiaceae bacterium]|nr:SPOR domain-containing protein [Burkholderiaceae bacterium]